MKIFKTIFYTILILLVCKSSIFAQKKELVYLKNGSIIEGKIIDSSENKIKIHTKCNCTWSYDLSEVDRIEKTRNQTFDNEGFANFTTLNFMFGRNDYSVIFSPGISTINGMYFLDKFYAGAGLGIEYYDFGVYPVFLDLKYFTSNKKNSLFLDIQGGYSFANDNGYEYDYSSNKRYGGLMFAGEIGLRNSISDSFAITMSVGYKYQIQKYDRTYWYWDSYYDYDSKIVKQYNRIFFKFGFVFG